MPPLDGAFSQDRPWRPPQTYVAVLWASPFAFRRGGVWARLLGEREWVQVVYGAKPADIEALVPESLRPRTVLVGDPLDWPSEQVVAALVAGGQVILAMQDSPTESAWEQFEREMQTVGL